MKLVTEYLEQAVNFERMAEQEADEDLKAKLLEQANAYLNLAEKQHVSLDCRRRRGRRDQTDQPKG
jgi:hypothetical protein